MLSTLTGRLGAKSKLRYYQGRAAGGRGGGRGVASVMDVQSLSFLLVKIEFVPSPDIMLSQTLTQLVNILQTRNLPFDSDIRSHSSMIPLHCL